MFTHSTIFLLIFRVDVRYYMLLVYKIMMHNFQRLYSINSYKILAIFLGPWTIKKAESWIIDAFELWCWRRLLRVPWTARRSNQSVLKEINPQYSLEGLILNLKLQYFGHLMQRADSLEKTLMLGKIEGRRRRGRQRMDVSGRWWRTGKPGVLQSMGSQRIESRQQNQWLFLQGC